MTRVRRALIALAGALLLAAGTLAFGRYSSGLGGVDQTSPTGAAVWTKAICDTNNSCIDFLITCEDGHVIQMKPTLYAAQFGEEWKDPRPEELRNELC